MAEALLVQKQAELTSLLKPLPGRLPPSARELGALRAQINLLMDLSRSPPFAASVVAQVAFQASTTAGSSTFVRSTSTNQSAVENRVRALKERRSSGSGSETPTFTPSSTPSTAVDTFVAPGQVSRRPPPPSITPAEIQSFIETENLSVDELSRLEALIEENVMLRALATETWEYKENLQRLSGARGSSRRTYEYFAPSRSVFETGQDELQEYY